jgi:hypothetical protein
MIYSVRVGSDHYRSIARIALLFPGVDQPESFNLNQEVYNWLRAEQEREPEFHYQILDKQGPVVLFSIESIAVAFKLIYG